MNRSQSDISYTLTLYIFLPKDAGYNNDMTWLETRMRTMPLSIPYTVALILNRSRYPANNKHHWIIKTSTFEQISDAERIHSQWSNVSVEYFWVAFSYHSCFVVTVICLGISPVIRWFFQQTTQTTFLRSLVPFIRLRASVRLICQRFTTLFHPTIAFISFCVVPHMQWDSLRAKHFIRHTLVSVHCQQQVVSHIQHNQVYLVCLKDSRWCDAWSWRMRTATRKWMCIFFLQQNLILSSVECVCGFICSLSLSRIRHAYTLIEFYIQNF